MIVGSQYYIMSHAYHHFVGEVTEFLGQHTVVLKNVVRVQSCQRGWTEFNFEGFKKDTTYTHWRDGTEITGWFVVEPFPHPIPKRKE